MSRAELIEQLPWLTALGLLAVFALALWRVLPRAGGGRSHDWRRLARREEGSTGMLDFVLVFPFFVMIVLSTVQLAMLVNARITVSYAAFAAARAAIVWSEEGLAEERARRAAQLACTPVSRRSEDPRWLLWGFRYSFVWFGGDYARDWETGGRKAGYSEEATRVELSGPGGPRDPVTATVTHQFYLNVPWADGIFLLLLGGDLLPVIDWGGILGGSELILLVPTVPVRDSYTLLNEGKVETI